MNHSAENISIGNVSSESTHVSQNWLIAYYILLATTGLIGNSIAAITFGFSRLRKSGISPYLLALAISDLFMNLTLCFYILPGFGYNILHVSFWCKAVNYTTYNAVFISAWLVTLFTIERFIVVYFPFLRMTLCTRARARCIVATLFIISFGYNIWVVLIIDYFDHLGACVISPNEQYLKIANAFNIADTAIAFSVPTIINISLNAAIAVHIAKTVKARNKLGIPAQKHNNYSRKLSSPMFQRRASDIRDYTLSLLVQLGSFGPGQFSSRELLFEQAGRNRRSMVGDSTRSDDTNGCQLDVPARYIPIRRGSSMNSVFSQFSKTASKLKHRLYLKRSFSSEQKTTIMLFTVSLVHIVLNLPSYVTRIIRHLVDCCNMPDILGDNPVLDRVVYGMFNAQSSFNFVLYTISNDSFRTLVSDTIQELFRSVKWTTNRSPKLHTMSLKLFQRSEVTKCEIKDISPNTDLTDCKPSGEPNPHDIFEYLESTAV